MRMLVGRWTHCPNQARIALKLMLAATRSKMHPPDGTESLRGWRARRHRDPSERWRSQRTYQTYGTRYVSMAVCRHLSPGGSTGWASRLSVTNIGYEGFESCTKLNLRRRQTYYDYPLGAAGT